MRVEKCPQCGAPAKMGATRCDYCGAEFVVTSLAELGRLNEGGVRKYLTAYNEVLRCGPDNIEVNCAMGICYLDLGDYDRASKHFERAVDQMPTSSDPYYYYALALLGGRRAKLLQLREIKRIEQHLKTAIQMDPDGSKPYYLWALVRHDYYVQNGLTEPLPGYRELVSQGNNKPSTPREIDKMLERIPIRESPVVDLIRRQ